MSGFFVAKMPVRPEFAGVSSVFVLVFALPSYMALYKWLGNKEGVRVLIILGLFAVVLESIAIDTGFPYGHFSYGEKIGAKVWGLVPWTVPFAWTPLLLFSMSLAARWTTHALSTIALSALLLVIIDMVLDPAAVAQGFWTYAQPGNFYQVPFSNFCGWFLSGAISSWVFQTLARRARHFNKIEAAILPPVALMSSSFLILSFWTSVCFWMELWLPTAVGTALLGTISCYLFSSQPTPLPSLSTENIL
ncbi:MAG: carotenoid biosynthesis protein [Abitibacteriaceae bacterium]|nr:carotenoid biosynthesis protein [Abditibacteriaceae bacterium]